MRWLSGSSYDFKDIYFFSVLYLVDSIVKFLTNTMDLPKRDALLLVCFLCSLPMLYLLDFIILIK